MGFLSSLFGRKKTSVPEQKPQPPQPPSAPRTSAQPRTSPEPSAIAMVADAITGLNIYPPGSRVGGRYEVASRPLMGGMGLVYLCLDREEDDRPVALKTFRPEFLPDREARDRFLREGTTWVDLGRHPHIVRAYGVTRVGDGTEVFLVLEQIAKEQDLEDASLRSWLTPGGPLPVEWTLLIALQVVRGLKYASEKIPGFVHRDLKPENVLVGADRLSQAAINRVRVTDFGLAHVLEGAGDKIQDFPEDAAEADPSNIGGRPSGLGSRTRLTRGLAGTPLYMAPEQWRGEAVSAATDMYALGCMLYEMLTGQPAATGRTLRELEQAHLGGGTRAWPEQTPEALKALVERCLVRDAGARYGDWAEMEQALCGVYAETAGRRCPPPEPEKALERGERVALGWAQSAIGSSYLDIGKADVAVGYYERARAVGKAEKDRALEGAGLGNLGSAYLQLGEAQKAVGFYEESLAISRKTGDRRGEGSDLGNLGGAYFRLGEARKAIDYLDKALVISREVGNRRGEGMQLSNLGNAYADLGEMEKAIECHERALGIHRQIGSQTGTSANLSDLGVAYRRLGDVNKAIGYYEQALAISREIGNRHGEGTDLGNLGVAYLQAGEVQKAITYLEPALAISREIGDRRGERNHLGNLGNAFRGLDETGKAVEHFQQAIDISREIGDMRGAAMDLFNMALLLAQKGRIGQALPPASEAKRIFMQIGSPFAQQAEQLVAILEAEV